MKKNASLRMAWYENRVFLYPAAALFIIGILPFFLFDKVSFFIIAKQWHHPIADFIAPYLTWVGDGTAYICFISIGALLRMRCRKIIIIGGSFACTSVVVQLLKRIFFAHMVRPSLLIPAHVNLHLVYGVELLTDLSFPSGHSGTIFTLVSVIQLLSKNKKKIYSLLLLWLALLVAYSRVYLCQHFYTDVYVGALIGTLSSIAVYLIFIHFNGPHWLDRSIYFFAIRQGYRLKNSAIAYLLVVFGLFFSVGIKGIHLFDLDELYFAEITREMMLTGNYGQVTFNFEPLYEKPPLFFWIQAASMHLWGINEIGARFPNIVCGLLTIVTLYYIGKKYKGTTQFGLLWMSLHATSFLPYFYFKSGIIDPLFNYFLLLSVYFLSSAATESAAKKSLYCAVSGGISIGLALLAKGPMGAIIPLATLALSCTWVIGRTVTITQLVVAMLTATVIVSGWLIPEIWHNGFIFIQKFWDYHLLLYQQPVDAHHQPWYYHYLVLFFGCFPSSLFAIAFLRQKKMIQNNYFAANMQAVWAIVLLIFTLVGTKIVHYSSMAYFPITFFAADFLYELIYKRKNIDRWVTFWFIAVAMAIGGCAAIIPWLMLHKTLLVSFIKNQYVTAAWNLPVIWNYWDSMPGIIYIMGVLIAFRYLLQFRFVPFIWTSMCISIWSLTLFLIRMAPKVEGYTQKAMVDFCKAYQEKDVYLTAIGFKAAAPLFYTKKSLENRVKEGDTTWLLEGPIDKPCFFILYKRDAALLEQYKDITYLQNAGCFAFYERLPKVTDGVQPKG